MTPGAGPPASAGRWIVLVARGQEDLYRHLLGAFQADAQVEVLMDRRRNLRRNPAAIIDRLRTQGVAVIRRRA